jgi:hypothetical protein
MKIKTPAQVAFFGLGALAVLALFSRRSKKSEAPTETPSAPDGGKPAADKPAEPPASTLTPEEIMGKPEFLFPGMAGYTRAIPKLPPEANSFARQGLSKPYGAITGPSVLSDGKTYIAVTESHLDDHVTNPKTGLKDKHWHKGVSLLVQA